MDHIGSTIRNALLICSGSMMLGSTLVALSFGVARQLWEFIPLFGAGQFLWFAMQVRMRRTTTCLHFKSALSC